MRLVGREVWKDRCRRFSNGVLARYLDPRPPFFDVDTTRPELRILDRNLPLLRRELNAYIEGGNRVPRYHEVDPRQDVSRGAGDWRVIPIESCGSRGAHLNRRHFPETSALLDRIPDLRDAFYSLLDPKKAIPRHSGPYLGQLRYHLGIEVPAENPPSIRVADEVYTWREGESMMFDDSLPHEVFNDAEEPRIILIVDVLRPGMPWPLDVLNRCMAWTPRATRRRGAGRARPG